MSDLALASASELHRRMVAGDLAPSELLGACLERVDRFDGTLNAICTLSERSLEEARRLERGRSNGAVPGPLWGLPVGIKDTTDVAGLRTTYGSPLFAEHVPSADAVVVRRLREAGAVVLGKTNVPEFAAGGNTFNRVFGATRNPWDPSRSAGGSTGGGAAALAGGLIALADGTDLGGSLRMPASFCGVVGLRPSPGLVPLHPGRHFFDTLSVAGPLGRTVEDVARMLEVLAGPTRRRPIGQSSAGRDYVGAARSGWSGGVRIGYVADPAAIGIDEGVESVCRRAAFELAQAGGVVEEVDIDLTSGRDVFRALRGYWMVVTHYERLDRLAELGPSLRGNIEAGLRLTTEELARAEAGRLAIVDALLDRFERYDLLLTPTMAVPPFPVEEEYPQTIGGRPMETYVDWFAPTFVFSLTGLPVASVPCGLDAAGLPVGLQVVGPPRGEEAVLAGAAQIQHAQPIGLPPLA